MNYRCICAVLGLLIVLLGVAMLPSLGWSLYFGDGYWLSWIVSVVPVVSMGTILYLFGRGQAGDMFQREALAIVGLGWLVAAAVGSVPFLISRAIPSVTDAFFETMSGFTTTGATILNDIEVLPPSILFWRSTTHWLGGIGIVVIFIAVIPFFSAASRRLFQSELPGITAEGLKPRIKQSALALVKIYLGLSVIECILLMFGGLDLFGALCHTFGTMATGGFSTWNASIGHFHSVYIEIVIIVFMFLAGTNFTLHYFCIRGRPMAYLRDTEFRTFLFLLLGSIAAITGILWFSGTMDSLAQALRASAFTSISINTATGYCTADFDQWPNAARGLLAVQMVIGGCGGSTAGGMKVVRFLILFRVLRAQLERTHSPHSVRQIKIGGRVFELSIVNTAMIYFFAVFVLFTITTLILLLFDPGVDLVTAVTSAIATFNNVGPGLAGVGASQTYAFFTPASKWVLSLSMVLGRLEIFPILVLVSPAFWRKA